MPISAADILSHGAATPQLPDTLKQAGPVTAADILSAGAASVSHEPSARAGAPTLNMMDAALAGAKTGANFFLPGSGPAADQLEDFARGLLGDAAALVSLPGNATKVLRGKANKKQEEQSRRGFAAAGGFGMGALGATLGGLAGTAIAPGVGTVLGAGVGGGLLGGMTYSAVQSPGDDPAKAAVDGLIGAVVGGVTAGMLPSAPKMAEAARISAAIKSGKPLPTPAYPDGATIPKALEAPPQLELPLNPEAVAHASPNASSAGDVMIEGARRVKFQRDEVPGLKAAEIVRTAQRGIRKAEFFSARRAADIKAKFTAQQRQDMTFLRERTENPYIQGDTPEAVGARLSPEAKQAVVDGGKVLEEMRRKVNESGFDKQVGFLEDYISHLWVGKRGAIKNAAQGWVKNNPFANARQYATFAEGMKKGGLIPRTVDFAELVQFYENVSNRVIATNKMLESLKSATDATGNPLLQPMKEAPMGYKRIDHPLLRQNKMIKEEIIGPEATRPEIINRTFAEVPMAVHPDAYPMVNFALQQPFSGGIVNFLQGLNAYAKKAALSASLFHHFTLTEQAAGALGIDNPKYFLPPIVIKQAGKGLHLLENADYAGELIDSGVTLSAPSDVHVGIVRRGLQALEAKTQGTPVGPGAKALRSFNDVWDDVLWNKYYNGLKAITYYELKERALKHRPDVPEAQIRAEIGEAINNIYGGQAWDSLFGRFIVDPRTQQILHGALLAPDWTLSNLAAAAQATDKRPIIGSIGRKALFGHALYIFTSSQLLNLAFTSMKGQPHLTFDNDPGHELDVELPWKDPEGRKMYMTIGKSLREVGHWITKPVHTLGSKLSPAIQIGTEQLTNHTTTGFPTEFDPDVMEKAGIKPTLQNVLAARAVSLIRRFIPISLQGNNAFMAFPASAGMTNYKTIKMMEAALKDNDFARISVISQHARENGLDASALYQIARKNAKSYQRAQQRRRQ